VARVDRNENVTFLSLRDLGKAKFLEGSIDRNTLLDLPRNADERSSSIQRARGRRSVAFICTNHGLTEHLPSLLNSAPTESLPKYIEPCLQRLRSRPRAADSQLVGYAHYRQGLAEAREDEVFVRIASKDRRYSLCNRHIIHSKSVETEYVLLSLIVTPCQMSLWIISKSMLPRVLAMSLQRLSFATKGE
jgi:hypothetical protein